MRAFVGLGAAWRGLQAWVDASILEANMPAAAPEFRALHNRVIEAAISLFPGCTAMAATLSSTIPQAFLGHGSCRPPPAPPPVPTSLPLHVPVSCTRRGARA